MISAFSLIFVWLPPQPRASAQDKADTYLLVELIDVVVGLVLGLNEGGMLLDFLGRGHLGGRARRRC